MRFITFDGRMEERGVLALVVLLLLARLCGADLTPGATKAALAPADDLTPGSNTSALVKPGDARVRGAALLPQPQVRANP